MEKYIITVCTNQFFLMFLAITLGLLIGKIKIKNFSLGVSGGIFSGIVIGYIVTKWANSVQQGQIGYSNAKSIVSTGVVSGIFFTFFLLLFLLSIGLKVGSSIGTIFKKYGIKFVIIGISIPVVSMLVAVVIHFTAFRGQDISQHETVGMFAGAMTSTPGYGTALDASNSVDYQELYNNSSDEEKNKMLMKIDESGQSNAQNTKSLDADQIKKYKEVMASQVSLGYTVAFPIGVLVIVILISILPKIFRIDIEKEKQEYQKELEQSMAGKSQVEYAPLDFGVMAFVGVIGIFIGNITIPLGNLGSFSLGAAGGVLLAALILSYIGKIGPVNFRMNPKSLGSMYQMGLTFFMAVVGLRYGYDVVTSLMGSGLKLAIAAIFVELIAVLVSFLIGYKVFKINWIILSGAIAGGCTSAPGLGAAISSTGSEEPTAGYGAAQPFAILANVLLATLFFALFL